MTQLFRIFYDFIVTFENEISFTFKIICLQPFDIILATIEITLVITLVAKKIWSAGKEILLVY